MRRIFVPKGREFYDIFLKLALLVSSLPSGFPDDCGRVFRRAELFIVKISYGLKKQATILENFDSGLPWFEGNKLPILDALFRVVF